MGKKIKNPESYELHQEVVNAVWAHRKAHEAIVGLVRNYRRLGVDIGPAVEAQLAVYDKQRREALKTIEKNMNKLTADFEAETQEPASTS